MRGAPGPCGPDARRALLAHPAPSPRAHPGEPSVTGSPTDAAPASSTSPATTERGALGFITGRPVAVTMIMVSLAVFGLVSFFKLRQDLLPEISYPTLTVRTTWEGAAPEDIEQRLSVRISEALSTLPGLVRTSSRSRAGVSDVLLEFDWNAEMTFAVQDVRERLDGVFLPDGAERPLILRYDPNLDPILRVGLVSRRGTGEDALTSLRWLAENRLERELEALEGVAAVEVRGGLEEEIRVVVDPDRLSAQNVAPAEIAARLAAENVNAAGGTLLEGSTEYIVRTVNEFRSVEELANLAIVRRGGATVRLSDLAEVSAGNKKREVVTRIAGSEAVELAIFREAGSNIVDLADRVKDKLFGTEQQRLAAEKQVDEGGGTTLAERKEASFLAHELRDDLEIALLSDQSTFIRQAVQDVQQAAVLGAGLAVVVIWIFLRRFAATAIIAVAIPLSVIVTFAPMYLAGVTLNIMSLGGLALGVGMLVDNAIVVLESITRCREEGDSLRRAAVRGTREVAGAVTASTLTTVSVFAPIVFVSGIAGQIFGDQALTVVTSLVVSLIVAILFIPMLASRRAFAGPGADDEAPEPAVAPPGLLEDLNWGPAHFLGSLLTLLGRCALWVLFAAARLLTWVVGGAAFVIGLLLKPFSWLFEAGWSVVDALYPRLLRGALLLWPVTLALAGLLLWDTQRRAGELGIELLPEIHQGEFTAFCQLDVGQPLAETDAALSALAARVAAMPEVDQTALVVGIEEDALSQDVEGPNTGRLTVKLKPGIAGAEAELAVSEAVRTLLASHPAMESVEIRRPTPFALDAPVSVEVKGYDLELLDRVAADVRRELETLPGLTDLRSSQRPGYPEVRVTFDRDKTLEYGLDLGQVATLVRDQVLGNVATRYTRGDDRIDVRVLAGPTHLGTLDDVLDLVVNPGADQPVPLSAVARVRQVDGPAEIRRVGSARAIVLDAETSRVDLGGLSADIDARLGSLAVPDGVTAELAGQRRELDSARRDLIMALVLAVFLVYVVMAAQFESLLQPLIILAAVPLAGIGAIAGLDLLGIPLSVVVFIGLIMLAGIVVNNAIVLVDRINQNRLRGLELNEAIVEAGRARLRPILMTTTTTALGLLPMTGWLTGVPVIGELGSGEGAELRAPMAVAVICGLVTSTLLTLVIVPTLYTLVARLEFTGRYRKASA
jgi:HAE1 family hydrophobic/amphiphilic exporter-1